MEVLRAKALSRHALFSLISSFRPKVWISNSNRYFTIEATVISRLFISWWLIVWRFSVYKTEERILSSCKQSTPIDDLSPDSSNAARFIASQSWKKNHNFPNWFVEGICLILIFWVSKYSLEQSRTWNEWHAFCSVLNALRYRIKRVEGHLESVQIIQEQESNDRICHLIFQVNIYSFINHSNQVLKFVFQIWDQPMLLSSGNLRHKNVPTNTCKLIFWTFCTQNKVN